MSHFVCLTNLIGQYHSSYKAIEYLPQPIRNGPQTDIMSTCISRIYISQAWKIPTTFPPQLSTMDKPSKPIPIPMHRHLVVEYDDSVLVTGHPPSRPSGSHPALMSLENLRFYQAQVLAAFGQEVRKGV